MSLSSYQAHNVPMGGSGGIQPISTANNIPNQGHSHNDTVSSINSLIGDGNSTSSSRGEFSNDPCITIDLFSMVGMNTAIWSEELASCSLVSHNIINNHLKSIIEFFELSDVSDETKYLEVKQKLALLLELNINLYNEHIAKDKESTPQPIKSSNKKTKKVKKNKMNITIVTPGK